MLRRHGICGLLVNAMNSRLSNIGLIPAVRYVTSIPVKVAALKVAGHCHQMGTGECRTRESI